MDVRKRVNVWYYRYTDENGKRVACKGTRDKRVTEEMGREAENRVARIKAGLVDPRDLAYRDHAARPLAEHLAAYADHLRAKGSSSAHVDLSTSRVRRTVALVMGAALGEIAAPRNASRSERAAMERAIDRWTVKARIGDLTAERVQKALATLREQGAALDTCNHYRTAVKAFSKWCCDTHRTGEDDLRGVHGFNAKADVRRERRALAPDEAARLVRATRERPALLGMTGPERAMLYDVAHGTGFRARELATLRPEQFRLDDDPPTITVLGRVDKFWARHAD